MNRDERMAKVVELRGQGLSLRTIGAILGVTHPTVIADLQQWEQREVGVFLTTLERPPGGKVVDSQVSDLTDGKESR